MEVVLIPVSPVFIYSNILWNNLWKCFTFIDKRFPVLLRVPPSISCASQQNVWVSLEGSSQVL